MADNRPAADIRSEHLHQALVGRLQPIESPLDWAGVQVITARDISEVFGEPHHIEYDHKFEATTPALGVVDLVCLHCGETIPDVAVTLGAVTTTDKPGVSKVRLKATANVRTHTCGQQALPRPVSPEVEGQEEAFPPYAEGHGNTGGVPSAEAMARDMAELRDDEVDDADLLPGEVIGETPAPKKRGRKA